LTCLRDNEREVITQTSPGSLVEELFPSTEVSDRPADARAEIARTEINTVNRKNLDIIIIFGSCLPVSGQSGRLEYRKIK
jgi:hypothetical protein